MIWRLIGYNDAGDQVQVLDLSADLIKDGNAVIVCPMDGHLPIDAGVQLRDAIEAIGIRVVVASFPIQVWKVEIPE